MLWTRGLVATTRRLHLLADTYRVWQGNGWPDRMRSAQSDNKKTATDPNQPRQAKHG